jgi:hypothetical protein
MARLADALPAVREFTFQRGSNRGPYINYFFESRSPRRVWRALRARAFADRRLGAKLRRASIVTCQGSRGWDDYLLLHHFDKNVVLDRMADV